MYEKLACSETRKDCIEGDMHGAGILPADMGMKIMVIKGNNCDKIFTLCMHARAKGLIDWFQCLSVCQSSTLLF